MTADIRGAFHAGYLWSEHMCQRSNPLHGPSDEVERDQAYTRWQQQTVAEQYIIEFDSRIPAGPMLVGPFGTQAQADAYVRGLHLDDAAYSVCLLAAPGVS